MLNGWRIGSLLVFALAIHELGEDAPGAPNVDLGPIVFLNQDDLRWPIPSRDHVVAQAPFFLLLVVIGFK